MAEVIYLQARQRPPKGKPYLLIECRRGRGGDEMASARSGCTIRIGPETLADTIADFRERSKEAGAQIYVRGVVSATDEMRARIIHRTRRRPTRTPTIEDLQREEEIGTAIAEMLKSTVRVLTRLATNPPANVAILADNQVRSYLSSAPNDAYAQRRALEKLWKAMPHRDEGSSNGWAASSYPVLSRLERAWRAGA